MVYSLAPNITSSNEFLDDFIWKSVDKWHDKTAFICTETKRSYTYSDAYRKCNAIASFLYTHDRVKQHDITAVILPNVPEYGIILLGAIRAGLVVTTVNPSYSADEISRQLVDSNSKLIFTTNELYSIVKQALVVSNRETPIVVIKTTVGESLSSDAIDFNDITEMNWNVQFDVKRNINDTIILPYSSGTTGLPKGVELTHHNITSNLLQMTSPDFHLLSETNKYNQDVVPLILPVFHIYGLTISLLNGMLNGCKMPSISKFSSNVFLNVLKEFSPTIAHIVPPIFLLLLNNPRFQHNTLSSIRTLVSGAAPLGGTDIERFQRKTKNKISLLQAYGLTETSPLINIQGPRFQNKSKPGGIGFLLPCTEANIVSTESKKILGANEPGEIIIRGPQVMKGYYNNQEATKRVLFDGWFQTGDVGYYNEFGEFFITDRIKELIKVKGFQVAPAELEEIIRNHPCVEDVAVVGVPHAYFGEVPKAFVVRKSGININHSEIQEYVKKKVVHYKQLMGGISFIDTIPKSTTGKILRKVLKDS
ncbi:hypothetical protein FQA39_LY14486 [Lamprigera yunnana]|nr:hypothetical protein FQA39_LY14486 [Lamprigera yunnana]